MFIVFLSLPPTLSRNNQVLKPKSPVKKSWNSINIFLVLFSVLYGVFAWRNDETASSDGAEMVPNSYEFVTSGRRSVSGADLLDSPDRKTYDEISDYTNRGGNILWSSSSSSPDVRHESLWGSDFEVDFHRPPGNFHRHVRLNHEVEKDVAAETPVREIPVDKFEFKNSVPPSPTQTQPISQVPQPPPPPPPPVKRRQSVRSVPKQHNVERRGREAELNEKRSSLPSPSKTPPPTLPPPHELKFHPLAERREKIQRKKSGITKEIATATDSILYEGTQRKRDKKVKSRHIFESVTQNSSPPTELMPSSIPSVPPPPPPPPPSKNVLQSFFKKSSKSKRVHSVSIANPPPPPPPPPQHSIFNNIFITGSKSKRFQSTSASSQLSPPLPPLTPRSRPKHSPASTGKPPKPSTPHHESVVVAPASPLIPLPPPPPPPPPPFTVPEMKFIAKGDFVRIRSANNYPCSSLGLEDFDVMSVKSDGGDAIGPSFTCPIPDVDLKADTFISKRRDEWRLEKINSLKQLKHTGSLSARLR